jgi:hypothetical protein
MIILPCIAGYVADGEERNIHAAMREDTRPEMHTQRRAGKACRA